MDHQYIMTVENPQLNGICISHKDIYNMGLINDGDRILIFGQTIT